MPKVSNKKKTNSTSTVARKNRRSPYEVLLDLKAKRESLIQRTEQKLAKYDEKISHLEEKFQRRIALEELKASRSADELVRELEETKRRQSLLRQALKLSSK